MLIPLAVVIPITYTPGQCGRHWFILGGSVLEASLADYLCYFSRGDLAPVLHAIECDHDGEAITRGAALLDKMPAELGLEIWRDSLLLARVTRAR